MLEEILKSINSNLERVANALEDSNRYLKEPIKISDAEIESIVKCIGNIENKKVTENASNTTTDMQRNQIASVAQDQVLPNTAQGVQVQTQQPVAQPVQAPIIPTTLIQESFTQEQLAVAMSRAVSAGKMNIIQGILQNFGVQALTQINPTDYNKVATLLKEAGVEV